MGPAVRRTSASSRSGSYGSEATRRMFGGETMAGTPARSRYAGGSSAGAVYIIFLNSDGTVKAMTKISNSHGNLASFYTLDSHDYFGSSIAAIGDLDSDGVADLAVGASEDDDQPMDPLLASLMTPGVTPHGPVDPARIPGTEWVRDAVEAMVKTAVGSNPRFPDTWAQKTTKTLGTAVAQAAWALSIFANRIRRELETT